MLLFLIGVLLTNKLAQLSEAPHQVVVQAHVADKLQQVIPHIKDPE
jgi:hypothetical protein